MNHFDIPVKPTVIAMNSYRVSLTVLISQHQRRVSRQAPESDTPLQQGLPPHLVCLIIWSAFMKSS